ncbi:MAG TPA: radical SAM protein, partial [Sphingomicrobium sp.]|nr:radical SAM protein [Sphingomicrobium sp.]
MPAPALTLSQERTKLGTENLAVTANIGNIREVGNAVALYVHWPFCVSKCPYCDFNSHVRSSIGQDDWRKALLADLAYEADLMPDRKLTSIFFGGGTPSLMEPSTVAAIISAARMRWNAAGDL